MCSEGYGEGSIYKIILWIQKKGEMSATQIDVGICFFPLPVRVLDDNPKIGTREIRSRKVKSKGYESSADSKVLSVVQNCG